MSTTMPLSPEDIHLLKNPFGILIHDKYITKRKIKAILKNAKQVISVGDCTTDRLISFDIIPDILVIDGIERRTKRSHGLHSRIRAAKELHCINPPGSISKEAILVLYQALAMQGPVKVIVNGEEDMLAVPVIAIADEKAVVLYGQPLEGMVVVNINPEMQAKAKNLMERIGLEV